MILLSYYSTYKMLCIATFYLPYILYFFFIPRPLWFHYMQIKLYKRINLSTENILQFPYFTGEIAN